MKLGQSISSHYLSVCACACVCTFVPPPWQRGAALNLKCKPSPMSPDSKAVLCFVIVCVCHWDHVTSPILFRWKWRDSVWQQNKMFNLGVTIKETALLFQKCFEKRPKQNRKQTFWDYLFFVSSLTKFALTAFFCPPDGSWWLKPYP